MPTSDKSCQKTKSNQHFQSSAHARFAKAIARAEFGRNYTDDADHHEVLRAMKRVRAIKPSAKP